jgi:tight adherence protein B
MTVTGLAVVLVGGAMSLAALVALAAAPVLAEWRLVRRARRRVPRPRVSVARWQTTAAPILRDGGGGAWSAAIAAARGGARLRARIEATGRKLPVARYLGGCAALAVLLTAAALLAGIGPVPALAAGLLTGALLPWWVLGRLAAWRRARFARDFPDAIGLIVRGLRAGLPVADTLVEVGRELPGPVGEGFAGIASEIRLGQAMEAALWALARKVDLPAFNFFVITLSVQRETGGNLAETLSNLDEILRAREAMQLKIRAMSSEAVASAAIIGGLPLVMGAIMFVASPGYLDALFTTSAGHVMLAAAAISLATGALVMRQMVRFEA